MSKKILYISSINPLKGPGAIAMDHYRSLLEANFDITFLTTYPVTDNETIQYVLKKPIPYRIDMIRRLTYYFSRRKNPKVFSQYYYFYKKENQPPVPIRKILSKVDNDYDAIIIFFWQGLLSYKTLYKLYKKQKKKPKVIFMAADYSPMTGGCHFFGECRNYETGCGNCPMINSHNKKDFTAWNVRYRKKIINKIKPVILINSYMKNFFKNSSVIKAGAEIDIMSLTLDLEKYKPLDKKESKDKYEIGKDKFVILFGAQSIDDKRKGVKYLVEALNILYSKLTDSEKEKICLVTIGKSDKIIHQLPPFSQKHLGFVSVDKLPEIYSLADIFISPSINDAGPSMVNQSLACGTPVISFEMGTALDVVKDQGSGVCVPVMDSEAMSKAIDKVFHFSKEEYQKMSNKARAVAMDQNSYKLLSNKVSQILSQ